MKNLMKFLKNPQKMLGKFYVQNYLWNFRVKYYKNFWGEICNNFKEHVQNISAYGNIVKNLRKFFEKLLGKFDANIG